MCSQRSCTQRLGRVVCCCAYLSRKGPLGSAWSLYKQWSMQFPPPLKIMLHIPFSISTTRTLYDVAKRKLTLTKPKNPFQNQALVMLSVQIKPDIKTGGITMEHVHYHELNNYATIRWCIWQQVFMTRMVIFPGPSLYYIWYKKNAMHVVGLSIPSGQEV